MNRPNFRVISLTALLIVVTSQGQVPARGFGGFRGGGGFGGFRGGGGFSGFRGGGGFGGYRGGGFGGGSGGFRGDEGGFGGYRGGEAGFGGYRGDEGGFGGYRGGEGDFGGYRGAGDRNIGYHPGGYGAGYRSGSLNRGELNGFLGLPTDAGLHTAGGDFANVNRIGGQGLSNELGTHPFSSTYAHAQGQHVQNWASNHPQWQSAWNSADSGIWRPTGTDAAAWATAAWAGAAWPAIDTWLGWGDVPYYPYDYGQSITYQGDNVYDGSQQVATANQYYQQASNLASGSASPPANNADWMPLGVFGLVKGDDKHPTRTFQLALDKQGNIHGNSMNQYFDVLPVQGAVDKKTQRVCWTVGTDKSTVYDTGLYNLTKSEAPILVHTSATNTQQDLLVRMKQPNQPSTGTLSAN